MHTIPSYVATIMLSFLLFAAMFIKDMYSLRVHCNHKDHQALLNFKHSMLDSSSILSSWSAHHDCCQWRGVQCDNTTGRVTMLDLSCYEEMEDSSMYIFEDDRSSNCMTGELNLSLPLQVEFLNYLDLSFNDLQATYCHSCQNSSKLEYLGMSYNEDLHIDNLQNWLSHLPSLKVVIFDGIDLHRESDWLQYIPNMLPSFLELGLSNCQLRNIHPTLQHANFTSLKVLDLSYNDFGPQVLPFWLFNLSAHTSVIDLKHNVFRGHLPEALLNLRNLKYLHLDENELSGPIPNWLGQLEHLHILDLGFNSFSGLIPLALGNLSSLIELEFEGNSLTGVVSEKLFVNLSNLLYLSMGSQGLIFDFESHWVPSFQLSYLKLICVSPKLPAWLYTQKSLRILWIESSQISFEPQEKFWEYVAQIEYLDLEGNSIDADMSNVLLNSTITKNSISGSISHLLCQKMDGRSKLVFLDMSNNLLSGGLTDCWANWKSLSFIKLRNNNLSGKIPESMSFLSNLVVLSLSKNNLFGEISTPLKNCHKLQILDLQENHFSADMSNCVARKAKVLLLRSNQFNGDIPPQICQLSNLIILDLADNRIHGSLPLCLNNLTSQVFNNATNVEMLRFNYKALHETLAYFGSLVLHVKGQEVSYGGNLKLVHTIDVSSNNMSGRIPSETFSLFGLIFLNLSHNLFIGNIPKEIGNMKQLISLDLSSNLLMGEIPESMSELSFLSSLNLSFNNFSRRIPLGTQLQGFDAPSYIGNPQLCGDPLPKKCTHESQIKPKGEEDNNDDEDDFLTALYIGMGVGFAVGFWGICGAIFFNRNFRHTYFRFLGHVSDKLYAMQLIIMNWFR